MKLSCQFIKNAGAIFCVFWTNLLPVHAQPVDRFAEIASAEREQNLKLATSGPPTLPDKVFRHKSHDPGAVFQPADLLDTPGKLAAVLKEARQAHAVFLEDHAPPQPVTRRSQKIESFDWRIATPDDWQNFPAVLAGAGKWEPVKIPHYGEPLGRTNTFYRTTFTLDAWQTNEAVFIHFRGVDYQAHVFVNGAFVGSHEGFFAPFEFDITRCVRPGSNALFVQVDNDFSTLGELNHTNYPNLIGDKLYAATGPGYDDPYAGWHHCPPGMGIYQPVSVEVRPRVHVRDLFVRPLPEEKAAEALIEVWSCDVPTNSVQIQFSVHGRNFAQSLIEAKPVEKPEGVGAGVNFYRVRFPMSDFCWWSPDEPWLYDFQVTVSCPSLNTTDSARRQFGMRSFKLDESGNPKGRFFLNGQEIRLRGANTMGFEQQDVMRGDHDQLRDDFLLAKIAHINFLRITQRPVPEEIYDMADRLGLMIQTDFPLFAHMRPNQFAESVRQVGEMERLIRSHPSCILVTYINERFGDKKAKGKLSRRMNRAEQNTFFRAADEAVRFQNPDRVIKAVDGDYDPPAPGLPDNHCYTLWYFRNGIDIGLLHKGYWQAVKPGWNYACGEFGAEGLDRNELMRARCPTNWLPQTAEEEKTWTPGRIPRAQTAAMQHHFFDKPGSLAGWVNASRAHQAWATQLMTEAFRRDNRMVSFSLHLLIDAWPTGWMKAIMDVERQPKPAYFAYREALTPLMANIRTDRWRFFSGEKMRLEFWVCNDTHRIPTNANIAWELEVNGKIVHAQRAPAKVRPVQSVFQGFTAIPAPEVSQRTPGRLHLALFDGERLMHDTAVDLEFYPKPKPLDLAVQVVGGPKGEAARLARQLRLRVKSNAAIYLIDDFAAYQKRQKEIDTAVQAGGRAIFLNLPKDGYVLPGSTNKVSLQNANCHFLSRATGHPFVAGFEPFDFRFWFDSQAGYITPLTRAKFSGSDWNPILLAQDTMAAAERRYGQGWVILNQVLLADRVAANPAARRFARRLLAETP
jgi:hypothetical protein